MDTKLFLKHFAQSEDKFPKLKFKWLDDIKSFVILGELDICDSEGIYWDTFDIMLIVGDNYPFSVPILIEVSEKIPRDDDRHISKSGICCIDMDHRLLKEAQKGINIHDFLVDHVYAFFANQLYYNNEKKYANSEWEHGFDGVVQFYKSELAMTDIPLIIDFLKRLLANELPKRNDLCMCKENKYKNCFHKESMEFLLDLPKKRIINDLNGFEQILVSNEDK